MSQNAAMQALHNASASIDDALKATLLGRGTGSALQMYQMLQYFFGFLDSDLRPTKGNQGGKRLRPALSLLIAEGYGAREKAFDAALAIELFHNFTLIHDDIEDRDKFRRNKPTLWRVFGINHAINSGDALSLMAYESASRTPPALREILFSAFGEVIEGQYMDFELASEKIGSEKITIAQYMLSIEKKTGTLFGAAAEVAGICTGQSDAERARLREYGRSFGIAFQLADDYRSLWGTRAETGKDLYGDIREHKRTFPFFAGYAETVSKARLTELYSTKGQLSDTEIDEVRTLINLTSARLRTVDEIGVYAKKARAVTEVLSLPKGTCSILQELVEILIPEAKYNFPN